MKKLTVGLVGYYGWGNYGDEFFKKVLEEQLPSIQFKLLHGVDAEGKVDLSEINERVGEVDVILIGGGDLVIPYAMSSLYWREEFLAKPVVVYGVGVPRWGGYNEEVVLKMREFLQNPSVASVTARDAESTEWISNHLKPTAPVFCKPDIVCAYQHPATIPRNRAFGLVLRNQGSDLPRENIVTLLRKVRERAYHPRLLMLGTDKTLADDIRAVSGLDLGDADIIVRATLEGITTELLACDRIASMKFHGCVVAMSHSIPCLALSQANKFRNFYADLDRAEWISSLQDADMETKLDAVLDAPNYRFPPEHRADAIEGLRELEEALTRAASAQTAA